MPKRRRRRGRWFWIALAVAFVSAAGAWLWREGFSVGSKAEPPIAEPAPRAKPASPPHEEIRDGERRALEKLLEERSSGAPANLPR